MNDTISTRAEVFLAAYRETVSLVRSICRRFGFGHEVDDMTQLIFLEVWGIVLSGKTVTNWKAFIAVLARRRCFDYLQDKKRRELFMQPCDEDNDPLDERAQDPAEVAIARESPMIIAQHLKLLSLRQRCILELRLEGWTNEEVASELDILKEVVAREYSRAIMKLRHGLWQSTRV
jgi:RNA polymerase sigma factor (sigma-70 family)